MKYQHNQLGDEWFNSAKKGWRPPMEFGFAPNNVPLGPTAVAFSVQANLQDLERSAVPPLEEFDFVSISTLSVSARIFAPTDGRLRPYLGGGYGMSRLKTHWTGPNYNPGRYDCFGACSTGFDRTLYRGFHPHLVGGLELEGPPSSSTSLLLEYRRDFGRGDDFYNLDGWALAAGLRWRIPSD